jgi:hypothetical protein
MAVTIRFTGIYIASPLLAVASLLTACEVRRGLTLPDGKTEIAFVRKNVPFNSTETIQVTNLYGSIERNYKPIGDPIRNNIYYTPANQIVVISQTGSDMFFDITPNRSPRDVTFKTIDRNFVNSIHWKYLGVIDRDRFIKAKDELECIPLLGAGHSPYRVNYQQRHC